jgi:hypothetical protein
VAKNRWQEYRQDLLSKVDFVQAYNSFGLVFTNTKADTSGWLAAKSHPHFGGEDGNPSAAVNLENGFYKDFRANKGLGIFDFMVEIGIATDWQDAQRKLAEQFGFKTPNVSKAHPEYEVTFHEWKDALAVKFCQLKPPITIEGLKRSGAMMCTWKGVPSFAWPIYDENLHVVGYSYMSRNGQPYTNGAKVVSKSFKDVEVGFNGTPAVQALLADRHPDNQAYYDTETVVGKFIRNLYWVEGHADLAAAYSLFPDSCEFITNPNGASQNVTATQARLLAQSPVYLTFVSDADTPGVVGAHKRSQQLVQYMGENKHKDFGISGVYCPYPAEEIQSKHGKDLRDWLSEAGPFRHEPENNTYPPQLGGQTLYVVEDEVDDLVEQAAQDVIDQFVVEQTQSAELFRRLDIRVLMTNPDGSLVLGCAKTEQIRSFRAGARVAYTDLLTLCGREFRRLVSPTEELNRDQVISFQRFTEELAMKLCDIKACNAQIIGDGLWNVHKGDEEPRICAVKKGAFWFPEDGKLVEVPGPDYGKYLADYEDTNEWFNSEMLESYLKDAADVEWRTLVHAELQRYIGSWRWEHPDMPLITTGLVYATWMQSLWDWRPIVVLTGESGSGKTYLLDFLSELFLGSASPLGQSTAAGVLQSIRNKSVALLLDEFDTASEQKKIFKVLRATSRGQSFVKGTATQKGKEYRLVHIPWISGISYATNEQADLNRMIKLSLRTVPEGERTIVRPASQDARELGHKVLASVMMIAQTARANAEALIQEGSRSRFRESYASVLAVAGAMVGLETDQIDSLLDDILENVAAESEIEQTNLSDQQEAMQDILAARVRLPLTAPVQEPTVATMLSNPVEYAMYWPCLEPCGVVVKVHRGGTGPGAQFVAIHPKTVVSEAGLLGKTKWRLNTGITQLLRRLRAPSSEWKAVVIGGQTQRCVTFKLLELVEWAAANSEA